MLFPFSISDNKFVDQGVRNWLEIRNDVKRISLTDVGIQVHMHYRCIVNIEIK